MTLVRKFVRSRADYEAGVIYLPPGVTLATGAALTSGSIRAIPLWVHRPITISELYARVTTADAAGNCQLAIANDAGRKPGTTLGSSGNVSLNVTAPANITGTLSAAVTITSPGRYWLMINSNSTTAVYVGCSAANTGLFHDVGADTLAEIFPGVSTHNYMSAAQTFGTWGDLSGLTWSRSGGTANAAIAYKVSAIP
jgi:hypothetical protein